MRTVKTLAHLFRLADERRSVIRTGVAKSRPQPAAMVQNYPARVLVAWLRMGMFAEYPVPKRRRLRPRD